jgi:hypothetical protein
VFIGCSDFLEQEPDLQVSINEQLSTREGVLQAYSGIYRDIEAILSSTYAVYADALGGNIAFTPSVTQGAVTIPGQIERAYNFNATQEDLNFDGYYDDLYDLINQVNLLLDRLNAFSFFSDPELNQLQAELLTIRAFTHYQVSLVFAQNYGFTEDASHLGVVYNTRILIAGEDFPARETMASTYNLIKMDLDDALGLYNSTQLLSGPSYSYFNSLTTSALYARIALQMNDWETARDFADSVITTSGINLTLEENYITEWEADELPVNEIILEFSAPRTSEGDVSSSVSAFYIYNSNTNYADYSASGDLLNLYNTEDIRSNMFLQQGLNTTINGVSSVQDYFFTKKFQDNAGTSFIRLSEMYLIRAESNARLNVLGTALQDLNSIRERANLEPLLSQDNLLDEIFLERRRELAFEGHLLFDIARFKKDVERNNDCIATVCNLNYPSNFYILPIPESSVLLNQNMQQNEGY